MVVQFAPRPVPAAQCHALPRGGVVVQAGGQIIQFGAPPETAKDTMGPDNALWKPGLFVIDPDALLARMRATGQTLGAEFAMYYGFFVLNGCKAPVQFATLASAATYLDMVLRTSYLGPQWDDFCSEELAGEYLRGTETPGFPDMQAELAHWAKMDINKLRTIQAIDEKTGGLTVAGVRIQHVGSQQYRLFNGDEYVGDIDLRNYAVSPTLAHDLQLAQSPEFQAARYRVVYEGEPAVIPITSSTGFDPKGGTSGHMIWNNGKVVFVDPPADILEFLYANHIPLEAVDGVMLTHVHEDHDPGVLPLLMTLPKAKLYTTASIQRMYVDKLYACSMGRIAREQFESLWDFQPLRMLDFMTINGLRMQFYHGFHSNIAFGYNIFSTDKPVFGFSGDTFNDPTVLALIHHAEKKPDGPIASLVRAENIWLLPFIAALTGGVSVHEQGAAPLHTTADVLRAAEVVIQQMGNGGRIFAYHDALLSLVSKGLDAWGDGFDNAVWLKELGLPHKTSGSRRAQLERVRRVIRTLPIDGLEALVRTGEVVQLVPGQVLMQQGDAADAMYLILDGQLAVTQSPVAGGDAVTLATLNQGIVGEGAFLNELRNATVTATETTRAFRIPVTDETREIVTNRGMLEQLRHIRRMRTLAEGLVLKSDTFGNVAQPIADGLFLAAEEVRYEAGAVLIKQGEKTDDVFLVLNGTVEVVVDGQVVATIGAGELVGEMALLDGSPRSATVRVPADGAAHVLHLPAARLRATLDRYPSLMLRLQLLAAGRKPIAASESR